MRYVFAIVSAGLFALLATVLLSSPMASWVVAQNTFESPDSVSNLHGLVFMATNLAALLAGWMFGWMLGGWVLPDAAGGAPGGPDGRPGGPTAR